MHTGVCRCRHSLSYSLIHSAPSSDVGKAPGSALGIQSKSDLNSALKELTAKYGDIEKGRDNTRIALSTW